MSLPVSPVIRLLVGALLLVLIAGCASLDDSGAGEPSFRPWAVLGDGRTAPSPDTIAATLTVPGDLPPGDVLTLAVDGSGIESVVTNQLPRLPETWDGLIVVSPGPADAVGASPLPPDRYGDLIDALLRTLRMRGSLVVSTIPETHGTPTDPNQRLTEARRLRHVIEYNDAIRAAALRHGAVLIEQVAEHRTGALDSRAPNAVAPASFDASGKVGNTANGGVARTAAWLTGFDDEALEEMRRRAAVARAVGQRLDVIAKLGDSITSSPSFLTQVTEATIAGSPHAYLRDTLRFFSGTLVPEGGTVTTESSGSTLVPSLARRSLGSDDRWYVTNVLTGGSASALVRELESIRPGVAVVMFGTNDLTLSTVEAFEEQLDTLLQELERRHVLPVLSTIPARLDQSQYAERVPRFNAAIRAMAAVHQAPLMEYAAAMAGLPNAGLSDDGIHPSVCPAGAGSFSPECLRYGYNIRNLLTLLALEKLHRAVLDDPAAPVVSQAGSGH